MNAGRDVMVTLIGWQPMPTVLAALQLRPAVVYGIYTEATRDVFNAIKNLLWNQYHIPCHPDPLPPYTLSDPFSPTICRATADTLIQEYGAGRLLFNLTGGTKVTALAMYGRAIQFKVPVIYVDSTNQRILYLSEENADLEIEVRPSVRDILMAHGSQVHKTGTDSPLSARHTALLTQWVQDLPRSACLLKKVARACQQKRPVQIDTREERAWLEQLKTEGILVELDFETRHRARVAVAEPQMTNFLSGIWLETYTYRVCRQTGLFDDVQQGVTVLSTEGAKDELDVVAARRGHLWLFQCKTGKVRDTEGKNEIEQVAAITLYQGGKFAHCFFVAAGELGSDDLTRARDRRIVAIDRPKLASLGDELLELAKTPMTKP